MLAHQLAGRQHNVNIFLADTDTLYTLIVELKNNCAAMCTSLTLCVMCILCDTRETRCVYLYAAVRPPPRYHKILKPRYPLSAIVPRYPHAIHNISHISRLR